jgi:acetolactate synthase I/II/III large subunit
MKMIKVSDYICNAIPNLTKSNHIFSLSGGGMMHILDSLGRSKVTPIFHHHEQAAAIAAYSYGRTLNSIGVCIVTSGPGTTNTITAVAAAYTDSVPMLFISGQVSRLFSQRNLKLRQRGFQEFNITDLVSSTTKYVKYVDDPNSIQFELEKACFIAKSGRPGPVWLDIPLDVQSSSVDICKLRPYKPPQSFINECFPKATKKRILDIIKKIKIYKRPLIILGHGVFLSNSQKISLEIIAKLKVPVQTTWHAIDVITDDNPLFFGRANAYGPRYANLIVQNADYILTIGCKLGVQHTGYNVEAFARGAYVDMVDLDKNESLKPFLNVSRFTKSDANYFLSNLNKFINKEEFNPPVSWLAYCNEVKDRFPQSPSLEDVKDDKYVDPYYFVSCLSDKIPEGATVPLGSSGTVFSVGGQVYKAKKGQRVFISKGMASMGFGLPSSIGAAIAKKHSMVTTFTGDGGFQLNIQELQTVKHHKLPIKIFVVSNEGYHAIRVTQKGYFKKNYVGSTIKSGVSLPNLKEISRAYGISYTSIKNNKEVNKKLKEIYSNINAQIIEVFTDPIKQLEPKLGSIIKSDGSMVSRPLEDLVPLLDRGLLKKFMYIDLID